MTTPERNLIREIRVHLWLLRCFSQRARERSIRRFIHLFMIVNLPILF